MDKSKNNNKSLVPPPQASLVKRGQVQQCQLCSKRFGTFQKEHQCKRCVRAVCEECSKFKAKIVGYDMKPNATHRICKICKEESEFQSDLRLKNSLSFGVKSEIGIKWAISLKIIQKTTMQEDLKELETRFGKQQEKQMKVDFSFTKMKRDLNYSMLEFVYYIALKEVDEKVDAVIISLIRKLAHSLAWDIVPRKITILCIYLLSFCADWLAFAIIRQIYIQILPEYALELLTKEEDLSEGDVWNSTRQVLNQICKQSFHFNEVDFKAANAFILNEGRELLSTCMIVNISLQCFHHLFEEMIQTQKFEEWERSFLAMIKLNINILKENKTDMYLGILRTTRIFDLKKIKVENQATLLRDSSNSVLRSVSVADKPEIQRLKEELLKTREELDKVTQRSSTYAPGSQSYNSLSTQEQDIAQQLVGNSEENQESRQSSLIKELEEIKVREADAVKRIKDLEKQMIELKKFIELSQSQIKEEMKIEYDNSKLEMEQKMKLESDQMAGELQQKIIEIKLKDEQISKLTINIQEINLLQGNSKLEMEQKMKQEIERMARELEKITGQLEQKSIIISAKDEQISVLTSNVSEIQIKLDNQKLEMEQKMKLEIELGTVELEKKQSEIILKDEQISTFSANISELKERINKIESSQSLQTQEQQEQFKQRENDLMKELDEQKQFVENKILEITQCNQKIQILNTEKDQFHKQVTDQENRSIEQCQSLQQQIDTKEQEFLTTIKQLESITKVNQELSSSFSSQTEQHELTRIKLEQEIKVKEQEIKEKVLLLQSSNQIINEKEQLNQTQEASYQQERLELNQKLERQEKEISSQKAATEKSIKTLQEKENEISKLTLEVSQFKIQVETFQKQVDSLQLQLATSLSEKVQETEKREREKEEFNKSIIILKEEHEQKIQNVVEDLKCDQDKEQLDKLREFYVHQNQENHSVIQSLQNLQALQEKAANDEKHKLISDHQKQKQELEGAAILMSAQILNLKSSFQGESHKCKQKEEEIQLLKQQSESLTLEIEKVKSSSLAIAQDNQNQSKKKEDQLQEALKGLTQERDQNKVIIQEKEEQIAHLIGKDLSQKQQHEQEIKEITLSKTNLRQELSEVRSLLTKKEKEMCEMSKQNDDQIKEQQLFKEKNEEQVKQSLILQDQNNQQMKELSSLKEQIEQQIRQYQSLQEQNEEQKKKLQTLKEESEQNIKQFSLLKGQSDDQTTQIQVLNEQKVEKIKEFQLLKEQNEEQLKKLLLQKEQSDLEKSQQIENLEKECQERQEELKNQKVIYDEKNASYITQLNEIEGLSGKMQLLQNQIIEQQSEINTQKQKMDHFTIAKENESTQISNQLSLKSQELITLTIQFEELRLSHKKLESQYSQSLQDIQEITQKCQNITSSFEKIKSQLEESDKNIIEITQKYENQTLKVLDDERKIKELENQLEVKSNEFKESIEKQTKEFEEQKNQYDIDLKSFREENQQLQAQHQLSLNQIQQQKVDLEASQNQIFNTILSAQNSPRSNYDEFIYSQTQKRPQSIKSVIVPPIKNFPPKTQFEGSYDAMKSEKIVKCPSQGTFATSPPSTRSNFQMVSPKNEIQEHKLILELQLQIKSLEQKNNTFKESINSFKLLEKINQELTKLITEKDLKIEEQSNEIKKLETQSERLSSELDVLKIKSIQLTDQLVQFESFEEKILELDTIEVTKFSQVKEKLDDLKEVAETKSGMINIFFKLLNGFKEQLDSCHQNLQKYIAKIQKVSTINMNLIEQNDEMTQLLLNHGITPTSTTDSELENTSSHSRPLSLTSEIPDINDFLPQNDSKEDIGHIRRQQNTNCNGPECVIF